MHTLVSDVEEFLKKKMEKSRIQFVHDLKGLLVEISDWSEYLAIFKTRFSSPLPHFSYLGVVIKKNHFFVLLQGSRVDAAGNEKSTLPGTSTSNTTQPPFLKPPYVFYLKV